MLQASLFGSNDGKGHSLVYYFGLPEGWEPSMVENRAALALWQRFVHDDIEADGCSLPPPSWLCDTSAVAAQFPCSIVPQ